MIDITNRIQEACDNGQHECGIYVVKSSQVNFFSDITIYIHKKIQFSIIEINTEIKTTATAVIKIELKHFLMSEANTCIAEPKLEILLFIYMIQ